MRDGSGRAKPSREEKEYTKPRPRVRSSSVGRRGPSGDWGLSRKNQLVNRTGPDRRFDR